MMLYERPVFWLLIAIGCVLLRLTPPRQWREARTILLALLNLSAMTLLFHFSGVWLALFVALSAGIAVALSRTAALATGPQDNDNNAKVSLWHSLVLLLPFGLLWLVAKQAIAMSWTSLTFLSFVGFSYLLIKLSTLIQDVHVGAVAPPSAWMLFAYLFHFPTYLLGPMHLFKEFEEAFDEPVPLDLPTVVDCIFRILLGLLKIKWLAAVLTPMSLNALHQAHTISISQIFVGALIFSVVLWADFSGACDLAIASSRLMGIQVPENFQYPYSSKNIRDFWQRWHITFSRVLTQYLFIPLSRSLQQRWKSLPNHVMIICYLITFGFCGYWHHPTLNFIAWGLFHAVGLMIYDLFRKRQLRLRMEYKKAKREIKEWPPWLRDNLARGLTFLFVSIGWIFFVLPFSKLAGLFS